MTMTEHPQQIVSFARSRFLRGITLPGKAARRLVVLALGGLIGCVAAWAGPGDVDSQFGASGTGVTLSTFVGAAPYGLAVIQQSDGKIVVAGAARASGVMYVARYNADGSPDSSFHSSGFTTIPLSNGPGAAYALLQQPDGKLVITGSGQNNRAGDNDIVVVRMNADGSLDTTFATTGIASVTGGGLDEFGAAIIRQSDGKLLVAGTSNTNRNYDYEFVRFNVDGTIDNTFGSSGKLYVDVGGFDDQANAMVQQADGAIVATGYSRTSSGQTNISAVRLSAAGALDTTFGTGGKLTISFGTQSSSGSAIAQQSDGKLLIAGAVAEVPATGTSASSTDSVLLRLNANGTADSSFASAGRFVKDFGGQDFFSAVLVDPSGVIYAGGRLQRAAATAPNDEFVARFSAAGVLDTSYGNAGVARVDCGTLASLSACTGYAMTRQADGKIVITGYDTAQTSMVLARLLSSGGYAGNVGFVAAAESFSESVGTQRLIVRRTGGSSGAISVPYTFADITTTIGQDYVGTNGTLTWADGDTADKFIAVPIIDDSLVEFTESFAVTLGTPIGGAGLATSIYTGSILDNDTATHGALQFPTTHSSVVESAGTVSITVGRAGLPTGTGGGAVSVAYATGGGTAVAGTRYTATSGTLSWGNGDTSAKTISIPVLNDTVVEPDQTVLITLSNPTGGAIVGPNSVYTLTITDDDGPGVLTLASTAANTLESSGSVVLTVSRTTGVRGAVTVDYATADGTATAGTDYTATSGTLSWADADVADKTITIPIVGDTTPEGSEAFTLSLSNPTGGATLGTNTVTTITILADNTPGTLQFSLAALSVAQTVGSAVLTVARSAGATGAASVQYQTNAGTAVAGTNFTATTGTLNWADGDFANKTISVPIANVPSAAADRTFTVTIFNPGGSGVLNANSVATVTILANPTPTSSSSGGKRGCFIATAAFGTPMASEVMELRHFRDGYLLKRGWGQRFVAFYYAHSPPIADYIRDRAWLRAVVRAALRPLIWIAGRVNRGTQAPAAVGVRTPDRLRTGSAPLRRQNEFHPWAWNSMGRRS